MKTKFLILNCIFLLSIFFVSCKKESNKLPVNVPTLEVKAQNHNWYYFTENGFSPVEKPKFAPQCPSVPWTEAVRISSANSVNAKNGETQGFAVVNRLGILSFQNNQFDLSKDITLFSDKTAGNLVFYEDTPLFSVYKSTFFNDSIQNATYKNDNSLHLFLVQFDTNTKISYPIINCNNITNEENSEVTDFYWDGQNWTCSIKSVSNYKNNFSYIQWKPNIPLLSISPSNASTRKNKKTFVRIF